MKYADKAGLAVIAGLALLTLSFSCATAQSSAAAMPRSGSAPERLPDDARPIEAAPETPAATEIRSQDEAKLLLGRKPLVWKGLAAASAGKAGSIEIVDANGLWRIRGEQTGSAAGRENDSVRIEGVVLRVLPNMFTIKGEVATRAAAVMNGVACKQSGTITFKRHPKDPFWRLLDNENPCTGEREVIEIRMDPPPAKKQAQQQQKRS